MRASIPLGRIAGIKVGINASVFLIVAILVFGLATGRLPATYPGRSVAAYVGAAIIAAVLFLASLLAHELAHSLVARRNGIEVDSIVLWLLGGVAQLRGEAKSPGADFRIAFVGPLTSIALGIVFGVAAKQPQHNAVDLDPVAAGHQRVGQLVRQQRGQEQHRGNDCRTDVGGDAAVRIAGGQTPGRESEHQDRDDEKHAGVDPNLDASDSAQWDGRSHRITPSEPTLSRSPVSQRAKPGTRRPVRRVKEVRR